MTRSLVGFEHDLDVGRVAHGGHCVARLPEELPDVGGTVVFVRHAVPGERVRVRVTEGSVGDRFLRADAVAIREPSPDRVPAPCSYAGPGLCGGCDFQHLSLPAQRRLKAEVVAEQLRRLAGIDLSVVVEEVPGDVDGLRWRTRMRFHPAGDGRVGLRKHRSHEVVAIDDCLIQSPGARVTAESSHLPAEPAESSHLPGTISETVHGRSFEVAADGFWQAHVGAPETLVDAVLEFARPRAGERVLDLYSGVGLFALFFADAVGPSGAVYAVEGDRRAAELAGANLSAYPWVRVVRGPVERVVGRGAPRRADIVVLDPPRTGARRAVVRAVARRRPRAVVYVACDPAAFARDVATFEGQGYRLEGIRAFDLFPMTHHVECVALLTKAGSDLR